MAKNNKKTKEWKYPKGVFLVFLFLIIVLFAKYCYLALSPTINGRDIQKFAESRNTVSKTLKAKRGTIYDTEGNVLAHNVTSYTLILYLDPKRSRGSSINHVEDENKTAAALAQVLEADENEIKEKIVNGKAKNKYQIELGTVGKNITEMKKSEIENLNLPGIDFVETDKRYYPNGDFASYILGYAKTNEKEDEDGNTYTTIDGELGIEAKFDEDLKGIDGYYKYQQDRFGYKIPDTAETRIEAQDGKNIYLTIDSNIQRFVETEVKNIKEKYEPEWTNIAVMDAKTGDILASSASPSFNPNIRDIVNYQNPLVTNSFEPGSTMKIYTYMCAIEKGTYDGNATFRSGTIQIIDDVIKDWNNVGWGVINYDKGFEYSSNVGVSTMIDHFINRDELKDCFKKYGFGSLTNIDLAKEQSGTLGFKYPVEVANASFGQGINTTVIQHLKALTMLSNNGKELTPHVVKKIVDPNTNKTIYKRKVEQGETLASENTINKIKDLMYNVVNSDDPSATGKRYRIDGFDVIGKTGTSQIYDEKKGGYLKGENDYIYSFAGMFPKDNPEVIIYAAIKKPNVATSNTISDSVVNLIKNIAKYRDMFSEGTKINSTVTSLTLESYINKKTEEVKAIMEQNNIHTVIIGDGDKIINQYPSKGETVLSYDKVFLITNKGKNIMPDLTGYSRSEVIYLMKTLGYDYELEGYGYVKQQSLAPGENVENKKIKIILEAN
ncbi:MAG: penicillin-binding protein [Bacilli bacterium]|nr:penicillin-binding protein [Bacilli bacterium]